MLEVRTVAF